MSVPRHRPSLITLDGIDGVGKSTQIERLTAHLRSLGQAVLAVRDPGSTPIGVRLRELLLDSDLQMHRRTEAMLFMSSRCEMIETTIRPALAAGATVISDRFLLANVVYQSVGGEVTAELLWELGRLANGGLNPDMTILLDMPAQVATARLNRPSDRMERRGIEYMEAVRQAFLQQLPRSAACTAVINAHQATDDVARDVLAAVDEFFSSDGSRGR
jgi:dTMP kinase